MTTRDSEPLPVPDGPVRYVQAAYPAHALTAHHLREFVRLLDVSAVPDDAVCYVFGSLNRKTGMITFRVDLDDGMDDDGPMGMFAAGPA